jgi:heme-degrading monooxygenase HmoA
MNRRTISSVVFALAVLAPALRLAAENPKPEAARKIAIARIWRGRTLASKADEYERCLNANGVAKIRTTPGNRGVTVLRRTDGDKTEFEVISIWESIEAVKNFAGADYQKAVILPRDREYLLEVEPNVVHYEILLDERSGAGRR